MRPIRQKLRGYLACASAALLLTGFAQTALGAPYWVAGVGDARHPDGSQEQAISVGYGLNLRSNLSLQATYSYYGSSPYDDGNVLAASLIAELVMGSGADIRFTFEGGLDDFEDFFYGIGIGFDVAPKIVLRLHYARHDIKGLLELNATMLELRFY